MNELFKDLTRREVWMAIGGGVLGLIALWMWCELFAALYFLHQLKGP